MFESLTSTALGGVRVVREYVGHHDSLLAGYDAAARQEMKTYSVSSSVTRLYAIYEHFVETLVSDYLDAIPEYRAFSDLSEGMRAEYRVGISHLLNRLDSPRYRHLNHENLILWYHEALSSTTPYRFVPEALTRHDENLRLSVLNGMFGRVQANDLQGWLSHHTSITCLFSDPTAIWERVESELRNFIQLRNDAAHGTLADLVGTETLFRYCDVVAAMIESLSAYLHRQIVIGRVETGRAILLGSVTEVLPQHRACIIPLEPGKSLSLNGRIHFVGQWSCFEAVIESLQIDGEITDGVTAVSNVLEVGVVSSTLPKRNVCVYADA